MKQTILGKVVFLGSSGSGKSSIILKYLKETEKKPDKGSFNVYKIPVELKDVKVEMMVYDASSEEEFKSIFPMYFHKVDVIVLVNDSSAEGNLSKLRNLYKEHIANLSSDIFVVDSKTEVRRQINGREFACEIVAKFFSCSAFSNSDIANIFQEAAKLIARRRFVTKHETILQFPEYEPY